MTYPKMSLDEWGKVGSQAQDVRDGLIDLLRLTNGRIPVGINEHLLRALNQIDMYRCKAEDRMFETFTTASIDIFYGRQDKSL